ncbi:MAG: YqiA/YcfP family alpha/beta fold hydrolase [Myxococcota bacterium]
MSAPAEQRYARLSSGLALYPRDPFAAHERWEEAWQAEPEGPPKTLFKGLIQLAAAAIKAREGNLRGEALGLAKAQETLAAIDPSVGAVLGIDVAVLLAYLQGGRFPPLPAQAPPRGILYLHGFASGPSSAKAQRFAAALAEIPLRIPDLNRSAPTPAEPEGHFDFAGLRLTRALAAARRCLFDRTIVVGSSLGGYLASLLAADARVESLILMAPAFDFANRFSARFQGPTLEVDHYATGAKETIGRGLIEDAARFPAFPPLLRPTAIFHGRADDTVPLALSERAVAAARPGAEVVLHAVDDDHALLGTAAQVIEAARAAYQRD